MIPLKKPLSDAQIAQQPESGQLAETEQSHVAEASQTAPATDLPATVSEEAAPVAEVRPVSRPTSRKMLVWIAGMLIFIGLAVGLYFLVGNKHNYWEDEAGDADTEATETYFEDY